MARRSSQVSPRTIWTVGFHLLLIAGTLELLRETWAVVTWILIALFLALALDPLVRWMHLRLQIRRGVAVLLVFVSVFGLVSLMVATFAPSVVRQGRELAENAPQLLERMRQNRAFRWSDARFHLVDSVRVFIQRLSVAPVVQVAGKIFLGVAAAITITSLTVFMLLFGGDLFESALHWFRPSQRARMEVLAKRMHLRVGGYVSGTLVVASIGGTVLGTTLAILGNPYFLPLALLMVVLGIIPWIGSALGAILLVATTFAAQGWRAAAILLAIYLVYQQVENHVLQPVVQRRTIKMNPLLIALVMLVGTSLSGLLGALLALPVAGAAQVILQEVRRVRQQRWRRRRAQKAVPDQLTLWDYQRRRELPH